MEDDFDINSFVDLLREEGLIQESLDESIDSDFRDSSSNVYELESLLGINDDELGELVMNNLDVEPVEITPKVGSGKIPTKTYPPEVPMDIDPLITTNDMMMLIYAEIRKKKIAGHHIDSMNSFLRVGIEQIATKIMVIEGRQRNQRDKTEEDREIVDIHYKVNVTSINLTPPATIKYKSGTPQLLTPQMAMTKNLTYSAQMFINANITATATLRNGTTKVRTADIVNHRIASIPCMTGTEICHTYNASSDTLKFLGEDPHGTGGVMIISGKKWTIDNLENLTNNTAHVYKNMHLNELARGTFLSKAGDTFENSYMIVLKYLNNGLITIEIPNIKGKEFEMPYYLLFRALGMTRDKEIVNHIVYGVDNKDLITTRLLEILEKSFQADDGKFTEIRHSTNPTEIIEYIARKITENANSIAVRRDENITKYLNSNILSIFDKYIFPHIGTGIEHRIKKLRFLGHLINRLLLVFMGVIESTDRDSYESKRAFAAGTSFAKTFKTDYNYAVVKEIKQHLGKDFKNTPFSQVQLIESVKGAINSEGLERLLTQSIVTGNKTITIKRNEITNRMSSTALYYKNDLAVKSTLNTINTPDNSASKQNERADEMRRVHGTYAGFLDISQSADTGEKVGKQKQMGCTASIVNATSSFVLKDQLASDPDIISLDDAPPERIAYEKLAKVFVNGDWIGCCKASHRLVAKYRTMRRHGDIHRLTTIVWKLLVREVYFWVDVGRLVRPLVIVYNNLEEYVRSIRVHGNSTDDKTTEPDDKKSGKVEFQQWTKLTREHIIGLRTKKLTMQDLVEQRIVEYISPEEQENAYLARNIILLREHAHNIQFMYTHCDIDQAIFGLVSLASPMANHSNATRITYYTNHRKQSAGWFVLNFPMVIDKNVTFQHYGERPLISTFTDSLTYPNGHNLIIGLAIDGGENQEDSITFNQSSIDCGAFNAAYYYYESAELDKNEQFSNPDYARTMDIKKDAVYEYTHGGFIAEGTRLKKGYVLIVKAAKIPKPVDQYLYMDKSIVYKYEEEAFVERVIVTRNAEDALICKVKIRANRSLGVGDKLCLTPDHDVLTGRGWIPIANVTMDDLVACLNPDHTYSMHRPTEIHVYDHDDDVYEVENGQVSQQVTLNHKMYVRINGDTSGNDLSDFKLTEARKVIGRNASYLVGLHYPQETRPISSTEERIVHYSGKVYCLTIPTGIFYVMRNEIHSWTGNSSRMGNKGIVSNLIPRCDMFYCEDGLIPDALVNPHSVPTRMAVNQLIEELIAIIAALMGIHIDATSFNGLDLKAAIKKLETDHKIKYAGNRRVYSGRTGEWKDNMIFVGPTTYQRLQKYVIDDHYAIREGPNNALTRQPLDGKNKDGGLRIGEMETWALSAAGVVRALHEKFYKHSDGINIHVCRICSDRAIINEKMGIYKCKRCGDQADIVTVSSGWSANLFFNEASAMNAKMLFGVAPHMFSKMQDS